MRYDINTGVTGRKSAKHTARNFAIGGVLLLVLLLGAGFVYTYYFGPEGNIQKPSKGPTQSATNIHKPHQPGPDAPESASIETITSPIAPGDNASLSIKTNATSKCTVAVKYNNVASTDTGLGPKIADEYGIITWTWTVEAATPTGNWPVHVMCVYKNGKSAVVDGTLVVAKP